MATAVEGGATLQIGPGDITIAVLLTLSDHPDFGFQPGVARDGLVILAQCGVLAIDCQSIDLGVAAAGKARKLVGIVLAERGIADLRGLPLSTRLHRVIAGCWRNSGASSARKECCLRARRVGNGRVP